jgi:DNA replication protein DnaC
MRIDEYIKQIEQKQHNRYELTKYQEENFENARIAFEKCCRSILPKWEDKHPELTDQIVRYALQLDSFNGDIDKGLILMGATGVGKTVYLKSLSLFMGYAQKFKFKIYTGFEMERIYQAEGEELFSLESAMKSKMFAIDDIGEEHSTIKRYGTEINVGVDALTQRHQLYTNKGYLTFATTNLNAEMIGKKYGKRIESRIYEMFNFIGVKGQDLRK